MHGEAHDYIARQTLARGPFASVVEFGSLDINGGVRELFGAADYLGLDAQEGPGVDVVTDVVGWKSRTKCEAVVCCEVLEHAADVPGVLASAFAVLRKGGVLLLTAACDPRRPHSAIDGGELQDGEHYANIDPEQLVDMIGEAGFASVDIEVHPTRGDVYAVAVKA